MFFYIYKCRVLSLKEQTQGIGRSNAMFSACGQVASDSAEDFGAIH